MTRYYGVKIQHLYHGVPHQRLVSWYVISWCFFFVIIRIKNYIVFRSYSYLLLQLLQLILIIFKWDIYAQNKIRPSQGFWDTNGSLTPGHKARLCVNEHEENTSSTRFYYSNKPLFKNERKWKHRQILGSFQKAKINLWDITAWEKKDWRNRRSEEGSRQSRLHHC